MKCFLITTCLLAAVSARAANSPIHISPTGNDRAKGSAEEPVSSLPRAAQIAQLAAGQHPDAVILFAAGNDGRTAMAMAASMPALCTLPPAPRT